jgi:hypothetical protein
MRNLLRAIPTIACIVLAACGTPPGGIQTAGVAAMKVQGGVRPLTSPSPSVSTADSGSNDVVICDPICDSCKTIGGGLDDPMGNANGTYGGGSVRRSSRLNYGFVADMGNSRVVVYTDKCSTVAILNDSVRGSSGTVAYYPMGVAVASDGTVAVTNLCPAPSCSGSGNVAFFASGSTEVTSVATGLMSNYFFGGFDKHGDFYNDGLTSDGASVVGVVKPGSTIDSPTKIANVGYPGGIQVARNGTINIDDQQCSCIRIYEGSTQTGMVTLSGTVDAITFAFTKTNSDIWVADKGKAEVDEFPYPAGGSSISVLSGFSKPVGVAVSPPSQP